MFRYDGIRIVPWPEPIGEDNQLPLVAVSADGIHCGNSRKGPTIRNCLVRCIPDDAIAIHGASLLHCTLMFLGVSRLAKRKNLGKRIGNMLFGYSRAGGCGIGH
jgi:hypothetical protein